MRRLTSRYNVSDLRGAMRASLCTRRWSPFVRQATMAAGRQFCPWNRHVIGGTMLSRSQVVSRSSRSSSSVSGRVQSFSTGRGAGKG